MNDYVSEQEIERLYRELDRQSQEMDKLLAENIKLRSQVTWLLGKIVRAKDDLEHALEKML